MPEPLQTADQSVPATNDVGSCGSSTRSPPIPAVVFTITSTSAARIRSTTSRYNPTSRDPLPVSGSRTWMCTIVAPARAAAMPDSAICSGVTGTCSERPTVSPAPVSAQVIITLRFKKVSFVGQRPFQTGLRFSAKALKPSTPSSEV